MAARLWMPQKFAAASVLALLMVSVRWQTTAGESCSDVLATVTLFSNFSSISNVSATPLLLRYNSTGFLNATNLDLSCTFPQCVFPAASTDVFIRTDLYRNETVVLNHGAILAIGPEVVAFPNGTRNLYFQDGSSSKVEQCQPVTVASAPNHQCQCGKSSSISKPEPKLTGNQVVTETILFADGTQTFNVSGQPTITVYPNATETTTFSNGTVKTRHIQIPGNGNVIALATQTLYMNGTQVFFIRGKPKKTICSNGAEQL